MALYSIAHILNTIGCVMTLEYNWKHLTLWALCITPSHPLLLWKSSSHCKNNLLQRSPDFRACRLFVCVYIQLGVLWGAWTSDYWGVHITECYNHTITRYHWANSYHGYLSKHHSLLRGSLLQWLWCSFVELSSQLWAQLGRGGRGGNNDTIGNGQKRHLP